LTLLLWTHDATELNVQNVCGLFARFRYRARP
jgi:hypothetical protein